jgi:hypothetical protein
MTTFFITRNNFLAVVFILAIAGCQSGWDISNPYEGVDWAGYNQYKGNFHTHTTNSDGRMNPQAVVDKYHELGYEILAITDHNEVTYPWTGFTGIEPSTTSVNRMESAPETMPENLVYEDRDPVAMGMIAIQANELSRHHHMGSYFNDHNGTTTEAASLDGTAARNGIAIFMHPGRYNGVNPLYDVAWYVDFFNNYDHLIGLEVYNQFDRYPNDRMLWDSILTVTMPGRPVWGFSNDDMHSLNGVGYSWNMLILPELTHESVRQGMQNGHSYFVYAPGGHSGPQPPVIHSIKVNDRRGTIEISATDYESVAWISGGKVLQKGSSVNLNELDENLSYIRAKVYGAGETVVGTQPFGIRRP